MYRVEQKNLAKFSDTCPSGIGSPRLVGGREAGNSNMQEFSENHKKCGLGNITSNLKELKCNSIEDTI